MEGINYVGAFFQNHDENKYNTLLKIDDNVDIEEKKKAVKRAKNAFEKAKVNLENEYEKKYSKKYTPCETEPLFKYKLRNETEIFFNLYGERVEYDKDKEEFTKNYYIVNLSKKNDCVIFIDGYCYDLGCIIIKEYNYNISSDNTKCSFVFKREFVRAFFDNKLFSTTWGFMEELDLGCRDHLYYEIESALEKRNCSEFINNLFGINREIPLSLKNVIDAYQNNKSFETIIKVAPDNLLKDLLNLNFVDKPQSIASLLKTDKETYKIIEKENLGHIFFSLREYIQNKNVFHKTDEEWVELIKDSLNKENDFEFFGISYGRYSWYDAKNSCLLESISEYYKENEVFRKYYTFGKFYNYLVEEVINQGYTELSSFAIELRDYLKMCEMQGIVPTLYSSYLKQTHDIASRNHKIFLDKHQEEVFNNIYKDYKPFKTKVNDVEYQVVAPKSSDDVKKEGDTLNHCVASYIKRIIDGETKILFLRKDPLESLITLEVRNGKICQIRGLHNRRADEEEMKAIENFAKKKELKINCGY